MKSTWPAAVYSLQNVSRFEARRAVGKGYMPADQFCSQSICSIMPPAICLTMLELSVTHICQQSQLLS